MTAFFQAVVRFANRYIPIFRKRAEKTAVNALLDKMKTASTDQKDVAVEESARNRR